MVNGLVSVIVPVYNCEKYLSACVDSILSQKYKKIEVLLIDDGTKDRAGEICDKYAETDERVKVIHRENRGVSETRKEGVFASLGEYVVFIDSDDYIDSDYIEKLINKAKQTESDIVCCNCFDEGITNQPNICIEEEKILLNTEEMLDYYFQGYRFAYVVWGKIFKRSIIEKIDFIKIRFTEDTHMMLNAFVLCSKIAIMPYAGYHYRAQENSVMACAKLNEVCNDTLVTISYLADICNQKSEPYNSTAQKKLVKALYCSMLSEIRLIKEKKQSSTNNTKKAFDEYYSKVKPKYLLKCGIKGIVVFLYKWFPTLVTGLIRILL